MAKKKKAKPDFSKPKEDPDMVPDTQEETVIITQPEPVSESEEETEDEDDTLEERYNGIARKHYEGLPVVAIAGRPNVGKSTLFNRFMQRRMAIVDPTPGVTRDPVEGTVIINGNPVHLIDTGGYKLTRDIGTMEAVLDDLVVERSLEMIDQADVVLLVQDRLPAKTKNLFIRCVLTGISFLLQLTKLKAEETKMLPGILLSSDLRKCSLFRLNMVITFLNLQRLLLHGLIFLM